MRTSTKLNKQLEEIKGTAIQAIKDFFKLSNSGRYMFNDPAGSILNPDISINGVLIEWSLEHDQVFYLIGEDEYGTELHEDKIEECNVEDLLWVLTELEIKNYEFEPAEAN